MKSLEPWKKGEEVKFPSIFFNFLSLTRSCVFGSPLRAFLAFTRLPHSVPTTSFLLPFLLQQDGICREATNNEIEQVKMWFADATGVGGGFYHGTVIGQSLGVCACVCGEWHLYRHPVRIAPDTRLMMTGQCVRATHVTPHAHDYALSLHTCS